MSIEQHMQMASDPATSNELLHSIFNHYALAYSVSPDKHKNYIHVLLCLVKNPSISPAMLNWLAQYYPVEALENAALPLFLLENPMALKEMAHGINLLHPTSLIRTKFFHSHAYLTLNPIIACLEPTVIAHRATPPRIEIFADGSVVVLYSTRRLAYYRDEVTCAALNPALRPDLWTLVEMGRLKALPVKAPRRVKK